MSEFVVKSDIPFGSAKAYTRGQTITKDAVEQNGWQEFVVGRNTKEARQIIADVTGEPFEDESVKAGSEKKG